MNNSSNIIRNLNGQDFSIDRADAQRFQTLLEQTYGGDASMDQTVNGQPSARLTTIRTTVTAESDGMDTTTTRTEEFDTQIIEGDNDRAIDIFDFQNSRERQVYAQDRARQQVTTSVEMTDGGEADASASTSASSGQNSARSAQNNSNEKD